MSLYDQYAQYRTPLNANEQEQVTRAQSRRVFEQAAQQAAERNAPANQVPMEPSLFATEPVAYLRNGRVVMDDPELDAYAQIGYNRARSLRNDNMPTTPNLDQRFPGIDPEGKHCEVDMDFAQRLSRLESAAAAATGYSKEILTEFIESYRTKQGVLGKLATKVDNACQNIKATEDAAKLCPHADVSQALENGANQMAAHDPDIQKMKQLFTAMEQVAGLRLGPIDQQTIAMYNLMEPKEHLYPTVPTGLNVKRDAPKDLNIDFPNFENVVVQNLFANPMHWGQDPNTIPLEPADSQALDACLSRYATGIATNALDGLFDTMEQYTEKTNVSVTRATLTIVDGKTVSEHMQEYYNRLENKPPFKKWYADNLKDLSGQIVAAGLMSGKHVETYVPGPDGKLPDQPTMLHRTGYAPTPEKPVTLTAWERFFNKFGFYKEKAAKAKEHQKLLDARERMKATYTAARISYIDTATPLAKEMFFGDFMRRNNINGMEDLRDRVLGAHISNRGKAVRGTFTGACIGMMAAMGHDIRDIMDPSKLVQEKKDMGELVMEKLLTNQTIFRLTDPKAQLTAPERQQLKDKLLNVIAQRAHDEIEHTRPKLSEQLAALSNAQREKILTWGAAYPELGREAQEDLRQLQERSQNTAKLSLTKAAKQELAQLKIMEKNADQTPMTDEQKKKLQQLKRYEPLTEKEAQQLKALSQYQQTRDMYRDLRQWQQSALDHHEKVQKINLQARQDADNLMNFLNEAENTPNYKLNLTDSRIPKYFQEGSDHWMGSVLFYGQRALTSQINKIVGNTDLKDPTQRLAIMPVISCAAQCMFDAFQDAEKGELPFGYRMAAHQTVMQDPKINKEDSQAVITAANQLAEDTTKSAYDTATFIRNLRDADLSRGRMMQPHWNVEKPELDIAKQICEPILLGMVNQDPQKPFSDRIPSADLTQGIMIGIQFSDAVAGAKDAMEGGRMPDTKTVLSGEFGKAFTVKLTTEKLADNDPHKELVMDPNGNLRIRNVPATGGTITAMKASNVTMNNTLKQQLAPGRNVPQNTSGGFRL